MIDYKRNITEMPKDAKEYPLIHLCTIQSRSSDYYKQSEIVGEHEGAMIIQPPHIVDNHLVFKDLTYYSWKGYYERPRDTVEVGNILMCKFAAPTSPYKSAVVDYLPEAAITNVSLFIIKDISCNPYYLQLVFSSPFFQSELKRIQNKGSMPSINIKGLYTLSVPVPSEKEQEMLVKKLAEYRDRHAELMAELNKEIQARTAQLDFYMDKQIWGM